VDPVIKHHTMKEYSGFEGKAPRLLNLTVDGGEGSASCCSCLYTPNKGLSVPI